MTPPVDLRPPANRPTRLHPHAHHVGKTILVIAVAALTAWMLNTAVFDDPTFIKRVTIDNSSEYDIHVDVGDSNSPSRVPLGVAGQRCTTSFVEVIDQGPTWVLYFKTQGRDGGQVTVERAQLERDDWVFRSPTRSSNSSGTPALHRPLRMDARRADVSSRRDARASHYILVFGAHLHVWHAILL